MKLLAVLLSSFFLVGCLDVPEGTKVDPGGTPGGGDSGGDGGGDSGGGEDGGGGGDGGGDGPPPPDVDGEHGPVENSIRLSWDAPTKAEDGLPLVHPVVRYELRMGYQSGNYTQSFQTTDKTFVIKGEAGKKRYWVVIAIDSKGRMSKPSKEWRIDGPGA